MNKSLLVKKLRKMAREQIKKDSTHGVWSSEFYIKVIEKLTQERINKMASGAR